MKDDTIDPGYADFWVKAVPTTVVQEAAVEVNAVVPETADGMQLADVPKYIEQSVRQLQELSQKVESSAELGSKAADAARDAAGTHASFGLFERSKHERAVIEALQTSGTAQAKAVEAFSDAQKVMFQYLSDVAKILRGLFVLGCASLAKNRTVVREVEARLRGASEGEINELARNELQSLLVQLNEQRDILERQRALGENQAEHNRRISDNAAGVMKNRESISEIRRTDVKQDELIKQNFEEDKKRDELIKQNFEADKKRDELIKQNFEEDKKREELIKQNFEEDKKRDELIKQILTADERRDKLIEELDRKVNALMAANSKLPLVISLAAGLLAMAAFVVAIVK